MIILADNNLRGAVAALRGRIEHEWADCLDALRLDFKQLEDVGLNSRSSDKEIYLKCLDIDAILVTSDKTMGDGEESLESVIRRFCRPDSPPVLTISNQVRVLKEADYQGRCANGVIECVIDIDLYRGVGRKFLP